MWSQYSGGLRDFELVLEMSSNPCLTFLLVYSALITIALIVTSSLLATNHSTVVCKGGKGGEEVVVNHYAVVDASKDEIDEGKPEQCKCHCNCSQKEVITGICGHLFGYNHNSYNCLQLPGIAILYSETEKTECSIGYGRSSTGPRGE